MLENYLKREEKKLKEESLFNEDYLDLYKNNFSKNLTFLLSSYHAWFNEELRDFNSGIDYGYYHADRSKRTLMMLNNLRDFTTQLNSELKLSSKYTSIRNQLKNILGNYGTKIPTDFKRIEIDEIIPIFESKGESFIKKDKNLKLQPIGKGSYAQVFKYYDEDYDKEFALKKAMDTLDEKELERFRREFDVMKEIKSPYVVEVYNYSEKGKSYSMELLDTTLLKYLQKNNQSITLEERFSFINQILRAFEHLKINGYFHRDISPNNILIKNYDSIKVIKISDFGLVKPKDSHLTSTDSEFRGSLNDPNLKFDGFKNYNETHETYALTQLIVMIISKKFNFSKIKDESIREFLEKGVSDTKNRYQTLEELKLGYLKMKNRLCN